jgi:hypothetical protein
MMDLSGDGVIGVIASATAFLAKNMLLVWRTIEPAIVVLILVNGGFG